MILELTEDETHDLYDMLYMMEAGIIKINKCQESYNSIFEKLEPFAIPELHENAISTSKELQELRKNPEFIKNQEKYENMADEYEELTKECNCGGIKGKDWSHETWCNLTNKKELEEETMLEINKIYCMDAIEFMKQIDDKSVDMILCDLPYGITQNEWDSVIPLDKLWKQYERIIKDNGAIVLTSQGLFTNRLISSNEKLFKYKVVWIKSKATNFLNAKKQPLRKHEDICIFYKKQPTYNPQKTFGEAYDKGFRKNQHTGSYGLFETRHVKSNGERYPSDIVYFKTAESEGAVHHPTQKPVALFKYLIRTYTNEGDLVMDCVVGSGTTAIACQRTNRNFICNDNKEEYVKIANERLAQCQLDKQKGTGGNT